MKPVSALVLLLSCGVATSEVKNAPEKEKAAPKAEAQITHQLKVDKLTVEFVKPPQYNVNGLKRKTTTYKKEWLHIEAKIKLEEYIGSKIIPELTATFHVGHAAEKNKLAVMRLSVLYKNVNLEDQEIWVNAYIDPDTLRIVTGKKNPTERDLAAIAVSLDGPGLFKGKKGESIPFQNKIYAWKGKIKSELWWHSKFAKHNYITTSKQKLRNKNQTPFAPLDGDRYPQIAPPVETAKN